VYRDGMHATITRAHAVFGLPSTGRPLIRPIVSICAMSPIRGAFGVSHRAMDGGKKRRALGTANAACSRILIPRLYLGLPP